MINEHKQEIIDFIESNNLNDIYTKENKFYELYNHNLYVYIRVSTEKQEFGRQLLEIYEWAKRKNITICIDYIFCDKYTGKTLNRKSYEELRKHTKKDDYILVSEVSRLGRDWDCVKEEWYLLKAQNINILIMDYDLLSATLPNEKNITMNVDRKFMQESIFNGILYVACKKIEEVSKSTKVGLKNAKLKGKKLGKPRGLNSNKENFIKTLKLMIDNNISQKCATNKTGYPEITFKKDLKRFYLIYNTKDYKTILENIKKDNKCQLF